MLTSSVLVNILVNFGARCSKLLLVGVVLGLATLPAQSQIITGSLGDANRLGDLLPSTGDISNGGDLMVTNDIELGGQMYLSADLFMEGSQTASDADQSIFFFEDAVRNGEELFWDNSLDRFELTDDLSLVGNLTGQGDLLLRSTGFFQLYNARDTGSGGPFFNWRGVSDLGVITTLMVLTGPTGGLDIRGTLQQNQSLDLAEGFWQSEPVEAGDVVALDPDHPGAVRRTQGAADSRLLGVVSERPGVLLGGGAFTITDLEQTWGREIAQTFEQDRDRLVQQVLDASPELQTKVATLASPEAFAASRRALQPVPAELSFNEDLEGEEASAHAGVQTGAQLVPRIPDETVEELATAQRDMDAHLEYLALSAFFEERVAPVALAGRVPVKVDARYGVIQPGDPLTASPEPGVAMRATEPGPILGTALEGLVEGRGKVLAFVHRGWSAGTQTREARKPLEPQGASGIAATATRTSPGSEAGVAGEVFIPRTLRTASPGLAEYHPVSEPIRPGEVVVAHREVVGALRAGHRHADRAVVGIAAGEPGVVLGERIQTVVEALPELGRALEAARSAGDTEGEKRLWQELRQRFSEVHTPVALAGTVMAKADADWGSIEVGDLLVTSPTRGHLRAEADPTPGTVVAKALEPLTTGAGEIRVLLMLR